jgi:hypothetical protein
MRRMHDQISAHEIGQRLGLESTDATLAKVEAYCELEVQKIVLKNEPQIMALKQEGSLLIEEEHEIKDKLQGAPSPGSLRNRTWQAIYYWSVTALLCATGWLLLIYTFAPFRIGTIAILYCLGAAIVLPFLFELTFQSPSRAKAAESVGTVACIAGLASLMLFAWVRGDILIELLSSTPSVVIDDAEPTAPSPTQPDFYHETIKLLRLALILLAFSMEVGAGLALREAKRTQSEDAADWGKLRNRRGEIEARLLAIVPELRTLENEGQAFRAAFWAEFYKATLTHIARSAMGKFLAFGVILLALMVPGQLHATNGPTIVVAVDLSRSVGVKDAVGKTEFEKNIDAVTRVLVNAPEGARITIIGITDHSFTQPYILLSATVPDDPGYFGERLRGARAELVRVWRSRAARLTPSFPHTDIIGALFLASELLKDNSTPHEKLLFVFSDMQNDSRELNLERGTSSLSLRTMPIANLVQVHVRIAGVDAPNRSITYCQDLQQFWTEYFEKAGAQLESYTTLR